MAEAFRELTHWIESLPVTQTRKQKRLLIFFDELPWLASPRSRYAGARLLLEFLGSRQSNLVLIVCGSAASWMIHNLLRNKGGLHNRVTHRFRLEPFNLAETREFYKAAGSNSPISDSRNLHGLWWCAALSRTGSARGISGADD